MSQLTLIQASEMRLQLRSFEEKLLTGDLSLFDRCELEDEILSIKEALGEFERNVRDDSGECINCSG